MIFNRFIFILAVIVIILSGCKKSDQITITGKITHAKGDTIYLEEFHVSSRIPVDKAKIDNNGRFKLKGEVTVPTFFILKLSNNIITLLLDSAENVVVEADAANFGSGYIVNGSLGSQQIKMLNENLIFTEHKLDSLTMLMNMYLDKQGYDQMKQKLKDEYNKIINEQSEFSKQFILKNPFSMASVYALYQKYSKDGSYVMNDFQTMRTAASALNAIYPNSDFVKALYENTLQLLRQKNAEDLKNFIQENGENSPDIVLPDANGKDIELSTLRGKVVLLQFWAAEDQNSRMLNSLLVEAYKKYNNKGFEIYQVNVGENRMEWVDAIDTDNLNWINVSDLEGCVKAVNNYLVKSIPANFLLDREGNIVAKDLSGSNLDKALGLLLN